MAQIKLGDLLVRAKVLSDTQLKAALAEQQRWGGKLGEILVRMNIVTEDMLVKALSKQLNIAPVNLDAIEAIPEHVKAKMTKDMAADFTAVPIQLRDDGRTLVVAMAEPQNLRQIDMIRAVSKCKVMPQVAGRSAVLRAFARYYEGLVGGEPDAEPTVALEDDGGMRERAVGSAFEFDRVQTLTGMSSVSPTAAMPAMGDAPQAGPSRPEPLIGRTPGETLRILEMAQRKEVAAIKLMVDMLIDKGIFTREEYLARVRKGA